MDSFMTGHELVQAKGGIGIISPLPWSWACVEMGASHREDPTDRQPRHCTEFAVRELTICRSELGRAQPLRSIGSYQPPILHSGSLSPPNWEIGQGSWFLANPFGA